MVHHYASRAHVLVIVAGNGNRVFGPVQLIPGSGVAPEHVAPNVAERVVLEEQVVEAIVENQSIRIVQPGIPCCEVDGRPEFGCFYGVVSGQAASTQLDMSGVPLWAWKVLVA